MFTIIRASLIVTFLLFTIVTDSFGDVAAIAKMSKPSVVTVLTQLNGKDLSQGSGFLLVLKDIGGNSFKVVVTNFHVIAGATEAKIKFTDGIETSVTGVMASNVSGDLVALNIGPVKYEALTLATKPLEAGERVIALGTPLGLEYTVTDGILSATRKAKDVVWLQHSAPISAGNSGGPLLNQNGEVVGVNTFKHIDGENLNFACSFEILEKLIIGKSEKLSAWADKHKTSEKVLPKTGQTLPHQVLERARISYRQTQKQLTDIAIEKIKRNDIPELNERIKDIQFSNPPGKDSKEWLRQTLRDLLTKRRELNERLARLEQGIEFISPILNPRTMRIDDIGHISSTKLVRAITEGRLVMQSVEYEWNGFTQVPRITTFIVNGLVKDDLLVTGTKVSIIPPLVVVGSQKVGIEIYYELVAFNVEDSKQKSKDAKPSPNEKDAKEQLALAKLYFEAKKEGLALHLLRKIVAEYPDTQASVEANKLIDMHVFPVPIPAPAPDTAQ